MPAQLPVGSRPVSALPLPVGSLFFQLPVGSLPVNPISCWFTSYQPHRTLPVSPLPASPLPFRPLPVSHHFPGVREVGVGRESARPIRKLLECNLEPIVRDEWLLRNQ